jgi:hypothetical protein
MGMGGSTSIHPSPPTDHSLPGEFTARGPPPRSAPGAQCARRHANSTPRIFVVSDGGEEARLRKRKAVSTTTSNHATTHVRCSLYAQGTRCCPRTLGSIARTTYVPVGRRSRSRAERGIERWSRCRCGHVASRAAVGCRAEARDSEPRPHAKAAA